MYVPVDLRQFMIDQAFKILIFERHKIYLRCKVREVQLSSLYGANPEAWSLRVTSRAPEELVLTSTLNSMVTPRSLMKISVS